MQASRTGRILMAVLLAAFAACSDDTTNLDAVTDFEAGLNGASEKPNAVTTAATGTATFSYNGTTLTFDVDYTGLSGNPSGSHIHIGAPNGTGPVRLNLCGAGAAPNCPSATAGSITGTADATYLSGATMDQVVAAMRVYNAYVNVHTSANAGGEIRGNIVAAP